MVRELKEDPWQRVRRVSAAAPGTPLLRRRVKQGRLGPLQGASLDAKPHRGLAGSACWPVWIKSEEPNP